MAKRFYGAPQLRLSEKLSITGEARRSLEAPFEIAIATDQPLGHSGLILPEIAWVARLQAAMGATEVLVLW